jgi:hypothetical protein
VFCTEHFNSRQTFQLGHLTSSAKVIREIGRQPDLRLIDLSSRSVRSSFVSEGGNQATDSEH